MRKYYYRYDYCQYGNKSVTLLSFKFPIIKFTAKGVWLDTSGTGREKRWVHIDALRSYAHSTKEKALKNFHIRKQRELEHIQARYNRVTASLNLIPKEVENICIENAQIQAKKEILITDLVLQFKR